MNHRSQLLHEFLMANARNDADEVNYLLEQLTEEMDDGGCLDAEEIQDAMSMTKAELVAMEPEDDDFEEDEDEEYEESYSEDDSYDMMAAE